MVSTSHVHNERRADPARVQMNISGDSEESPKAVAEAVAEAVQAEAESSSRKPLVAAEIEPKRPTEPEDTDRVTVLYGYGKVDAKNRFWLDNTTFIGGVAKHVPYGTAREWKKLPIGRSIHILPDDADEASYAKAAGIQPMAPAKLAAMIEASDVDAIFEALGPERARKLMQAMQARMERRT